MTKFLKLLSTGILLVFIPASTAWAGSKLDAVGDQIGLDFIRIVSIAITFGIGFAIGWLFSDKGRTFRRYVGLAILALIALNILTSNSMVSHSLSSLVTFCAFFVGIGLGFGSMFKGLIGKPTTFGSAEWADMGHIKNNDLIGTNGFRLGIFTTKRESAALNYARDRHLLTVAPTRSGKGTTAIIPNLLTYEGSVLVIDPKGENALITARRRKDMGQQVFIVDPWGIANDTNFKTARFNPLDWLVKGDVDITENAMLLADALIVKEGNGDQFWVEEAKALLQGFILYVATEESEEGQRHLGRVRDLLLLDGEDMPELFQRMANSAHHIVASTGARCLQKEEKLLTNVVASAQAQTHFLDSARIRESLSTSDFKFEDLKTSKVSIFLVLPSDRLHAFSRWLRLLIQQAITVNARNIELKPEKPILFLLDEMPALGRLAMVEQAYGLMAGFGIQLWGIVQDLSQLKKIYGDGWETFIGNSGVIQYFGSRDRITAEYFSALCGVSTVWNLSYAFGRVFGFSSQGSSSSSSQTTTTSSVQRKLAYPDELMRLPHNKQLILVENLNPISAHKQPWFNDPELKNLGNNLHK